MKLEMFSVYDSKAKAFMNPMFLPQVGQATRLFANAVNSKDHQFGANPSDYTLFHIGTFDDETAKITSKIAPENLGLAQEFKVPEAQLNIDFESETEVDGKKLYEVKQS